MSYFKSRTDEALLGSLWSSYWVRILCAAPLAQARSLTVGRTSDIARKLANLSDAISKSRPAIAGPSADRAQQHQRGGARAHGSSGLGSAKYFLQGRCIV